MGVSGAWKSAWIAATFALPTFAFDLAASSHARITFNSNGTFVSSGDSSGTTESGNWITPTSAAPGSFTIRAHVDSGTAPTGMSLDTDVALSGSPALQLSNSVSGTSVTCNLTLTIKDGGGSVVATGSALMQADCP